ncbi:MAG: tryptophan 7-halogenase, partial [Pseudomonadota bacterium]
LERYLGTSLSAFDVRKIPIRSGHRQCFWRQNCVAVGLSAGFLEPLEASALVLVELSATMLAEQLPATRGVMDIVARRFNDTFSYRWDRIIDFLKLHYLLSQREDSTFWIDNRDPASVPESLQELMTLWRHHSPYNHDFTSNNEVFPAASYQYVLYGMGFRSETSSRVQMLRDGGVADALFRKNREAIERSGSMLPSNRELLTRIRDYGLQPV